MSKLNESVANTSSLLDTYMYLDVQDKKLNNMSLDEALNYIKKKYPNKANTEEYKVLRKACNKNSSLAKMKIVSQSHYDHKGNDGKSFFNYSGKSCKDDPIQACAFKDENGNLYVAYRGTGDKRWGDNGQGFTETTDMQKAARDYFDHVADENGYNDLYVTGHSKGGNEAQYVTMTSKHQNDITSCYSIDGQGFSNETIEKEFKSNPNYEEIRKKMYSINGDNDPIHDLSGVIVPEENTYYVNTHYKDSNGKTHFAYFHDILGMINDGEIDWQRDENGNITHGTEGWLSKLGKTLNKNLQILPNGIKGGCAIAIMEIIDLIKGGSMDDAEANLLDFISFNVIGIPLVIGTLTEYAIVYMYEKHGVFGAVAAAIVSSTIAVATYPVILSAAAIAEAAYFTKKLIDSAAQLVEKARKLCQKAAAWADGIFNSIDSFFKNFREWLFRQSQGYKYATANPCLSINTTTMKSYASQLRALSRRSKALDRKMNNMYWHLGIEWDTIANLGRLFKSGIILDFAVRLDKCANYLDETAEDFDKVERELNSLC